MSTDDLPPSLLTDDPSVVIEFTKHHRHPNTGKRSPNKGGLSIPDKYRRVIQEVMKEESDRAHEELTEEEREFVDLIISGASQSAALQITHPDVCIKRDRKTKEPILDKDGKTIALTLDQLWLKADHVMKRPRIRAALRHRLEQDMEDVKHTSLRIHNFVQKRLMIEAQTAHTPASRIAALDRLQSLGLVAEREREQTKKMQTPEEVLEAIEQQLSKLGA